MRIPTHLTASVFLTLAMAASMFAQTGAPDMISFQGSLTDNVGDPITDGAYAMTFKLYTVPSGGSAVWTEVHSGGNEIQVTDGVFSVPLGELQSLSPVAFNQQLYLGITVESDAEISPRTPLSSSPYALSMRDIYSDDDKITISAQVGIGTTPTNRELTVHDLEGTGSSILNITAANRELLIGVNPSTGALIRGTTDNNLNLGANGSDHMTIRSDGDIRVHENLMIGTSSKRGMLTLRGPNHVANGPVIYLFGDGSNQSQSGRIRFSEATSSESWLGAFIHYDGQANSLRIGTHNTSDTTAANDLDAISISRSSRDVTIHEDLLAENDIRKDYGDGTFAPTTVFAMGVIDASPFGLDYQTANVAGLIKNGGGGGEYVVYFDESCPTSNARVPYVASITMYDPGVDDISAVPICRSSVACSPLTRCVTLEIRPYNVLGFVDSIDLQFLLHKIE